jgi:hypothetical protein
VIDVDYKRSLLGESLEAKLRRMKDLRPADAQARRVVLRGNRGIGFKEGHRLSHFVVNNGRIEIGSRAGSYFKLLNLNGEKLATIYADWIVNGETKGDL